MYRGGQLSDISEVSQVGVKTIQQFRHLGPFTHPLSCSPQSPVDHINKLTVLGRLIFLSTSTPQLKPQAKVQALLDKCFKFCLSSMPVRLTTTTNIAWQAHSACQFFCLLQENNVCQAHVCVMAKLISIVLYRQHFKCLPSNACSFSCLQTHTECPKK